jgi:hypothetical protein
VGSVLTLIIQTLASSALVIAGFIGISFTKLGERFLSHHLERRISEPKHAHNREIESLRADLEHLQDRGRRANELEFDALTKIWQSYTDAWMKVERAHRRELRSGAVNQLGPFQNYRRRLRRPSKRNGLSPWSHGPLDHHGRDAREHGLGYWRLQHFDNRA